MFAKKIQCRKLLWIICYASVLLVVSASTPAGASVIGNWSGSGRSWNNSEFATIRNTMIGAGHTVQADGGMTAADLLGDSLFVIGEAASTPGAGDLAALSAYINSGGILLMLADSSGLGVPSGNAILSGIGSTLSFAGGSGAVAAPFAGGVFATEGPPYNIVGQSLTTTLGGAVAGGTVLAGSYIHYQQYGSGYIFAFGDRSDHDFFNPTSANANGQLFLNVAAGPTAPPTNPIPAPGAIVLGSLGFGCVTWLRRRRSL